MAIARNAVDASKFNRHAVLPYELRVKDFEIAMQDVYDFFYDVNQNLAEKGLERLDDMLRPAIMSGLLSDMLSASMAKHSRTLIENRHFNGHPDLLVKGVYPGNSVRAGSEGLRSRRLGNQAELSTLTGHAIKDVCFRVRGRQCDRACPQPPGYDLYRGVHRRSHNR